MPKGPVTKKAVCITLDLKLLEELQKECKARTMKLSSYIEKLIQEGKQHEK